MEETTPKSKNLKIQAIRRFMKALTVVMLVLIVAIIVCAFQIASQYRVLYEYRYDDKDGDSIANYKDDDMDNDELLNWVKPDQGIKWIEDYDADGDYTENIREIMLNAEKHVGRWYDHLEGNLWNIGGYMGSVLPADVIVYSYDEAGVYISSMMRADCEKHPDRYPSARGFRSPRFSRTTDNLYAFFSSIDQLFDYNGYAEECDVIFYDNGAHCALVIRPGDDFSFGVIEASKKKGCVSTTNREIRKRGLKPTHIGRILD